MERYIQEQKKKIGQRIQKIMAALDLEPAQFAVLTKLTVNTVLNIGAGKGFNSNTILNISFYTGLPLNELLNVSSNSLDRKQLNKTFWLNVKTYNASAYKKFNQKRFTIVEAIRELAKNTSFFDIPKTTGEVRNKIAKDHSISLESSAVSQALLDCVKEKLIKKDKLGLRNFQYHK
ncbi:hypothetical protein [Aequorivita sp. CIP111184]|uniref:hypothetical protein n=1 Tax=Aequorivita sp. CIP111184 TaxID=2211356 RepID=UPI000DBBE2F0|nr:hypothetical protein [Aequorivita sp. CIP111184]SRX52222.1 hypothetical protein AEQU1_00085 [Aequorivita sp. CIP111184]